MRRLLVAVAVLGVCLAGRAAHVHPLTAAGQQLTAGIGVDISASDLPATTGGDL